MRIDPEEEAASARAYEIAQRWADAGLAAVPEMVAAICRDDERLKSLATGVFESFGRPALRPLIEAQASHATCGLDATIKAVMCGKRTGEAELASMLSDRRPGVVRAGLFTVQDMADTEYGERCAARAPLVAAALPGLRALVRSASGKLLQETLWTIERIGPDAAPLVPDIIGALDREEPRSTFAAGALEAIGPGAAPAVPKLIALLRTGGRWRSAAPRALGAIGPAATPALREFPWLLSSAAPRVCATPGRYSEADVIVNAVFTATSRIGGAGAEPVVPALAELFPRMRACRTANVETWLRQFGALGVHGYAASQMLLALAENPDEPLPVRKEALAALDHIGPRLTWWFRLRRLRQAIKHKDEVFAPPRSAGGAQQILPPVPPPPPVPPELALCRAEASLPPPPPHADPPVVPRGNGRFGYCVRHRLCGPDAATYRATMAACCQVYGARPWPWFCESDGATAR